VDRVIALENELDDLRAALAQHLVDSARQVLALHERIARLEAPARAAAEDLLPLVEPGLTRPDEGAC
jgi:hypothetical protein